MRFPSLFRIAKYQRFEIKPRYYDPIKEEIRERTQRIKNEMEGQEAENHKPAQISFRRKTKAAPTTSMIQLLIAVALGLMVMGWLQFGNDIFYYLLWIIIPGYLLYRLKTLRKRK
jgi:hypothetical protein